MNFTILIIYFKLYFAFTWDGCVFIQEIKWIDPKDFCPKSLWSNMSVGYSFSNSCGFSGGLITLWKGIVEVVQSFKGEGFLGIKVVWKNLF